MRSVQVSRNEQASVAGLAIVLFVALSVVPLGQNVHVLRDELTYSFDAQFHKNVDATYPVWLYLNIFSVVGFAKQEFYTAARTLNALIFAVSLPLIHATARHFTSGKWAVLVAVLATFSPVSSYTTFFMPDATYFTAFWLLTWFVLTRNRFPPLLYGLGVGALCGMATLVKPHGMFVLVAILAMLIALSIVNLRSGGLQRGARTIGGVLVAFLIVRFGVGYLFAGPGAFGIVGAYSEFTSNAWTEAKLRTAAVLGGTLMAAHLMAIAVWIGPGVVAMTNVRRCRSDEAYRVLALYSVIVGTLMFVICIAFSVRIADGAPLIDGYRVHMRYYNFLFPLFFIAAASSIGHEGPTVDRLRIAVGFGFAALAAAATTPWLGSMAITHLDAPELRGLTAAGPGWLAAIAGIAAIVCLLSAVNGEWGGAVFLAIFLPLATLVSVPGVQSDLRQRTASLPADTAGRAAVAILGENVDTMSIAGDAWAVRIARFTVDRSGPGDIDFYHGSQNSTVHMEDIPPAADWLLVIGDYSYPDGWQRIANKPMEWVLLRKNDEKPYSGQAFDLTDLNWTKGISKSGPVFFTANTPEGRGKIRVGRFVRFSDGQTRRVTNVDANGPYLNVEVSGDTLSPSIGFPERFEVLLWP